MCFPESLSKMQLEPCMKRLQCLDINLPDLGGDQRQLWITIAANAFMKLKNEPNRRNNFMQDAADEYTALMYEIRTVPPEILVETTQSRGAIRRPGDNRDTTEEP
jgi:hypothetical protein